MFFALILTFFTRLGSDSRISNSSPLPCRMISPRVGTRPAILNTRPASVSVSSSSSSDRRSVLSSS